MLRKLAEVCGIALTKNTRTFLSVRWMPCRGTTFPAAMGAAQADWNPCAILCLKDCVIHDKEAIPASKVFDQQVPCGHRHPGVCARDLDTRMIGVRDSLAARFDTWPACTCFFVVIIEMGTRGRRRTSRSFAWLGNVCICQAD